MKPVYKNRTSVSSKHIEGDQHRLVGQILDDRLRVISLNHFSPRQWLYQVEPPSVGKTRRALKILGDPLAREPGSFYRLKTAYDRLKRLDTPYIERVYECGLLHDLTPYILVEWEPHGSLYEHLRLRRKPLLWREAKSLFVNISRGLNAMHEQGIAHGDLRPQHILLRHPPQNPVIIDACINSAFGSPPVPGLEHSHAFWAPERRSLSTSSPASDMYSLGAIMYHCLQGHPPFDLNTSGFNDQDLNQNIRSPVRCIETAHVERQPIAGTNDVPARINALIVQLLSKSPRLRPTITEVLHQLDADSSDSLLTSTIDHESQTNEQKPIRENQSFFDSQDSITEPRIESDLSEFTVTEPTQSFSPLLMTILCSIGAVIGLLLAKV